MFFLHCLSGRDVKFPSAVEIEYTLKDRKYFDQIEKAFNYASKLLLELLMEEKQLIARIKYVIIFFFFSFLRYSPFALSFKKSSPLQKN